jgi:enoyl-CoA hydratase/carnithine racemase
MTTTLHTQHDDDGVSILTLNRPEARNALDLATMDALKAAMTQLQDSVSTRIVIITGAGTKAFSSGADVHEFSRYPSEADGRMMSALMTETLLAIERLPMPVIAAINGFALGGGSELALACDLRIADEKARMGFVHARMGLTPGWGAGQRLLRLVGYARALDLFLSSHILHAPELLAYGLVNRVVDTGTALEHAINYARHVATFAPEVIRNMKCVLQAGLLHPYDEARRLEQEIFPAMWVGAAHVEAVEAFLKRDKGRTV